MKFTYEDIAPELQVYFSEKFDDYLNVGDYNPSNDCETSTPWCCPWFWNYATFEFAVLELTKNEIDMMAKKCADDSREEIISHLENESEYEEEDNT